ncbi:MAG: hypothetical protein ACPIOQ_74970, partial [Promethearchaeia archaeon]
GRAGGGVEVKNVFNMAHTVVEHYEWLPPALRARGLFFWRAMTTRFLLRRLVRPLADSLRPEIAAARARMGWGARERVIGLHVRHGDSCQTNIRRGKCVPLAKHVAEVRTVAALYNITAVYVATDNPAVVGQTSELLGPAMRVFALSLFDRRVFDSGHGVYIEQRLARGDLDRDAALRFTLMDLWLLSCSEVLVGHFTSNMSRLAHLLMSLRRKAIMPFVSVDGPWCHHWQACCGTRRDGSSQLCPFVET